eukprot:scaffold26118_cov47-Phaeocystis_antarctica.AAC.3
MALAIPATEFSFSLGPSARTTEEKHTSSITTVVMPGGVLDVFDDRGAVVGDKLQDSKPPVTDADTVLLVLPCRAPPQGGGAKKEQVRSTKTATLPLIRTHRPRLQFGDTVRLTWEWSQNQDGPGPTKTRIVSDVGAEETNDHAASVLSAVVDAMRLGPA